MLDQHLDLEQCDVVIRRHNAGVVAAIPQFGLFAQAETVESALDGLEVKKKALRADLAAFADLKSYSARTQESQSVRWADIGQFAIKAGIVFALLFVMTMYLAIQAQQIVDSAAYKVQASFEQFVTRGGGGFWLKVERELERLANPVNDLPEDKRQKLLTDIRIIVERWRPFVSEASAIFAAKSRPDPHEMSRSGN